METTQNRNIDEIVKRLRENGGVKGYFTRQLVRHILDNENDAVLEPMAAKFIQKGLEEIVLEITKEPFINHTTLNLCNFNIL